MNPVALLAFFSFMTFSLLAFYAVWVNPKSVLNRISAAVNATFAWWNLGFTFFYVAPDGPSAWFWVKFAAPGWVLFPIVTLHYYLVLTGHQALISPTWKKFALYATPVLLILRTWLLPGTAAAGDVARSSSGLGWTYLANVVSPWWWLYVLMVAGGIGLSTLLVFLWFRTSVGTPERSAYRVILAATAVIGITGLFTDILLPIFGSPIPPVANIVSLLYAMVFFRNTLLYDLLARTGTVSSDKILQAVTDPVILVDMNGTLVRCNAAAAALFGDAPDRLAGRPLLDFLTDPAHARRQMMATALGKRISGEETGVVDSRGVRHDVLYSASAVTDSRLGKTGIVISFRDMTSRKRLLAELEQSRNSYRQVAEELYDLAHFDPLTRLPNRRLFFLRAAELAADAQRGGGDLAVIYLDLNGFKHVNDDFGHDIGDAVLSTAAERLRGTLRRNDLLARMGGDEFVMILTAPVDEAIAESRMEEVRQRFLEEIVVGDVPCRIGIACGCALFSRSGSLDGAMRIADQAMYADKHLEQEGAADSVAREGRTS